MAKLGFFVSVWFDTKKAWRGSCSTKLWQEACTWKILSPSASGSKLILTGLIESLFSGHNSLESWPWSSSLYTHRSQEFYRSCCHFVQRWQIRLWHAKWRRSRSQVQVFKGQYCTGVVGAFSCWEISEISAAKSESGEVTKEKTQQKGKPPGHAVKGASPASRTWNRKEGAASRLAWIGMGRPNEGSCNNGVGENREKNLEVI